MLSHLATRPALEEAFNPLVGASARLGCPLPSLGLWVGVWDYFGCVRSYSPANFPVPYGPVKLLLSCFVESGESRAREEEVLALNDTWGSWMKMHAKKRRKKKKGGTGTQGQGTRMTVLLALGPEFNFLVFLCCGRFDFRSRLGSAVRGQGLLRGD